VTSRPRILINFAVSLDGKINPAPERRKGRFVMSRGKEDWRRMRVVRAQADAILIGAENLRVDDPALSLDPDERDRRRGGGGSRCRRDRRDPARRGIRTDAKMFDRATGGPAYIVHTAAMPAATRGVLAGVAQLVEMGAETVPTEARSPGCATTSARPPSSARAGASWSPTCSRRAPSTRCISPSSRILGGATAPTLAAGAGFDPDQIADAKLASVERVGDELFLRYEFPPVADHRVLIAAV
jgi:riboflavin biosynthesis pyrimidine reductase